MGKGYREWAGLVNSVGFLGYMYMVWELGKSLGNNVWEDRI